MVGLPHDRTLIEKLLIKGGLGAVFLWVFALICAVIFSLVSWPFGGSLFQFYGAAMAIVAMFGPIVIGGMVLAALGQALGSLRLIAENSYSGEDE